MAENNGTADFSSGLFNAGSILQGFYEWEPASDDVAGQQLKNTFMSDTATNILNNEMSKDLASFNNSLATDQMVTAGGIQIAMDNNASSNAQNNAMIQMGAEYDYQSQFAKDQAGRDLVAAAQAGDIQAGLLGIQGANDARTQAVANQGNIGAAQAQAQGQIGAAQAQAQGNIGAAQAQAQGNIGAAQAQAQGNIGAAKELSLIHI